jgi:hypothetical protein
LFVIPILPPGKTPPLATVVTNDGRRDRTVASKSSQRSSLERLKVSRSTAEA